MFQLQNIIENTVYKRFVSFRVMLYRVFFVHMSWSPLLYFANKCNINIEINMYIYRERVGLRNARVLNEIFTKGNVYGKFANTVCLSKNNLQVAEKFRKRVRSFMLEMETYVRVWTFKNHAFLFFVYVAYEKSIFALEGRNRGLSSLINPAKGNFHSFKVSNSQICY